MYDYIKFYISEFYTMSTLTSILNFANNAALLLLM